MTTIDKIAAANERTLELVTALQEKVLEATKSQITAAAGTVPDASTLTAPVSFDVPEAKELIEETFKFQSRLLEANKSFALSLAQTVTDSVPAPEAKTASPKK